MRIQNNITAMNTHRMYTINNDNVAKSAAKLSSGYRINSAADDAAGLAISEKMRSQIRGLNMATKNSQDAISLVQTAEGALQETHSMLQRMNELAVQAATGTNESIDRTALAKEFEQLKREINDIAEQTTFNNMKILDGSKSYTGAIRSAATAGINMTVTDNTQTTTSPASVKVLQEAVDQRQAQAGEFVVTGTANELTDGKSYGLEIKIGDTIIKAEDLTTDSKSLTQDGASGKLSVGTLFNGVKFNYKGVTFTGATDNANDLKFTTAATPGTDIDLKGLGIEVNVYELEADGSGSASSKAPKPVASASIKNAETAIAAQKQKNEISLDLNKVAYGDTFTIGDKTYQVIDKNSKDFSTTEATSLGTNGTWAAMDNGNVGIVWNGDAEYSDLVKNLVSAQGTAANKPTDVTIAAVDGTLNKFTVLDATAATTPDKTIEDKYKVAFKYESANATSSADKQTTIEFDIAKMKDGDTFQFTVGDKTATYTFNQAALKEKYGSEEATIANMMANAVKDTMVAAGINGGALEAKGNALLVKGEDVSKVELTKYEKIDSNAMLIQVGALENEQLAVSIDAMNTAGLGLDNATLSKAGAADTTNQKLSGEAITAVRDAINKVSDQRATLGAMQNRLDHKIANLKVSSENLSAAESRIRDVDMASEMTNFTKNNILSQAATAMLAQANALPQNVLSLLG